MQSKDAILFYALFAEADSTDSFVGSPARNVAHIRLFNGHTLGAAQVLFVFGR